MHVGRLRLGAVYVRPDERRIRSEGRDPGSRPTGSGCRSLGAGWPHQAVERSAPRLRSSSLEHVGRSHRTRRSPRLGRDGDGGIRRTSGLGVLRGRRGAIPGTRGGDEGHGRRRRLAPQGRCPQGSADGSQWERRCFGLLPPPRLRRCRSHRARPLAGSLIFGALSCRGRSMGAGTNPRDGHRGGHGGLACGALPLIDRHPHRPTPAARGAGQAIPSMVPGRCCGHRCRMCAANTDVRRFGLEGQGLCTRQEVARPLWTDRSGRESDAVASLR